MKMNRVAPPRLPVDSSDGEEGPKSTESEDDVGTFKTPEPVKRSTRSKLRKAKVTSFSNLDSSNSAFQVTLTIVRWTSASVLLCGHQFCSHRPSMTPQTAKQKHRIHRLAVHHKRENWPQLRHQIRKSQTVTYSRLLQLHPPRWLRAGPPGTYFLCHKKKKGARMGSFARGTQECNP